MTLPICAMRRCTIAAPLMALAALTASDASARAATECVTAPKGGVPQGSHWYYRWDREGQRKCWYVGAWKGATDRDTTRLKTAPARLPVQQVSAGQQRVSDSSPVTWRDDAARQSNEDRIRQLLYGTEPPVDGDVPPHVQLRPSLAAVQTADAADGGRPTGAASALQSAPAGAPDEVARDTVALVPAAAAAQPGTPVAPAQTALYVIATVAIFGGLLHVSVKLARTRRQRTRINRRSALVLAAPQRTQRGLPPDRVRRFA
jgi:hypothetical protein